MIGLEQQEPMSEGQGEDPSGGAGPGSPVARRVVVGVVVTVVLVAVLFRGTDWAELGRALADVHVGWLLATQALLFASNFTRVQRWSYVVRAIRPDVAFRPLLSATQIGFLVNFTIPARIGELVRAVVLARLTPIDVTRSVAAVALDRVTDVVGLLAVLGVAAVSLSGDAGVTLPAGAFGNAEALRVSASVVRPAAALLGLAVLGGGAALALLYVSREWTIALVGRLLGPLSSWLAERVTSLLGGFADGLHVLGSAHALARALLWSLVTWGLGVLAIDTVLLAFSIDAPWTTSCLMMALIAVSIAVPVAPGVVGQYHVAAVASLLIAVPSIAPETAKAVALVAHASNLVPIGVLGVYSLLRERIGFRELLRRSTSDTVGPVGCEAGP